MVIFRWLINIQKQSFNNIIKKSQLLNKQSSKNILKIPASQQTIIQKHPENPLILDIISTSLDNHLIPTT
ncbi:MAG: hypothetical protein ACKPEO_25225, partial [Sphaerospermopsis kisseleviana]